MGNEFIVAAVQMDIQIGALEENTRRVVELLRRNAEQRVELTVFPECTLCGYCFDSHEEAFACAIERSSPYIQSVIDCCRELQTATVIGFIERNGDKIHNSVALIDGNGILSVYRKTHLPLLGLDRFTTAGTEPYQVVQLGDVRLGMLICYDCSFPEPTRVLSLAGADIVVLPTNWPPGSGATADLMPNARAFENHIYFMAVNRVGREGEFEFIGKSKICAPNGTSLNFANHAEEEVMIASLFPATARQKHLVAVPGEHEVHRMNDRRPDLYGPVAKR